jgi:ATP-dependent RNA helicase DeaD
VDKDGREAEGARSAEKGGVRKAGPTTGAPVGRSQNVVYVIPNDWLSIGQFLEPLLERVDETLSDVQLLVITSDAELAAAISATAVKLLDRRAVHVLGATSARRAARLIRVLPPQMVAGTAEVVVELLHGAAIKLDTIRSVCIAWPDDLGSGGRAALETLMAELPKDAPRTVVTSALTPWVDELLERYARRARRVTPAASDADQPTPVDFFPVAPQSRLAAVRRLLDETDPASALVFVRDRDAESDVRDLLRSLGYNAAEGEQGRAADSAIHVGLVAPAGIDLALLYDLPATRNELREATAGARRTIALVQPRQLSSLRSLAAGGAVRPFTLPEAGQRARDQELLAREELRRTLSEGHFGRELIALESLLDEYDGIEIAAAALQLLERERERAKRAPAVAPAGATGREAPRDRIRERESRSAEAGKMARLFLSVGARDNVRPGDLVGAIANEGGVSSSDVGKIDIRESHSIVEVAPDVADTVIERLNGVVIRGRRAIVRRDEDRGPRATGARGAGAGRPRSGSRAPRRGERE